MVRLRMPGRPSDRHAVKTELRRAGLHTVCEEAKCPNICECFGSHTATFLILGDHCTRSCRFCAIGHLEQSPVPDPDEPERLARAVESLNLSHAVITSVTRDDLSDGGAGVFAKCISQVRDRSPGVSLEVLVPDFGGRTASLDLVLDAQPDVLNHNVETVPRLYPRVRPGAIFQRSLDLLAQAAQRGQALVKSGIMVGLGESLEEVDHVLEDLFAHGCRVVTIGQYLKPARDSLDVVREVAPEEYQHWIDRGEEMGLTVVAGPLVRSSYDAARVLRDHKKGLGSSKGCP